LGITLQSKIDKSAGQIDFVGREERIMELKKRVKELEEKLDKK
jgi:hypothetical protein